MASIRPFVKAGTLSKKPIEPPLLCPLCNIEMRLFGIEPETDNNDLYTFECVACGGFVMTCETFGLSERANDMANLVAEKITELAQGGLKNPLALHLAALNEFAQSVASQIC